eukprot:294570-Pyramimonas_sp.AAC.1
MLLIGATMRRGHWIRNRWIRNLGSRSQWTSICGSAMGIATDPERAQAAPRPCAPTWSGRRLAPLGGAG